MSDSAQNDESATRRRRRPATSCSLCRKRKTRCNRAIPCSNCVRSKNPSCSYDTGVDDTHHKPTELLPLQVNAAYETEDSRSLSSSIPRTSTPGQIIATSASKNRGQSASSPSVVSIAHSVASAQRSLQTVVFTEPQSGQASSTISKASGTATGLLTSDLHSTDRGVISKTRLFGQTHWMNGAMLLRPMLESFERLVQDKSSQALTMLSECKSLARNIKAHRNPDISVLSLASLPTKEIADRLIDGYLRSSESIFRVLHIPSFKREYQGFWSAVADGTSNTPAVYRLQVKLVMAIGAATFDKDFSLRATAVQWVQEAETWLSRPSSKSRLSIPALQATILLHIARQTTGIGADLIWISTGTLIRTAIAMGMHRDPKKLPKTSLFSTEIRRRLWNTILEIAVQSSIDSGGPPMISLTDFDTEPPDNLDDMHLTTEDEHIAPQAVDIYTQVSVAIAMRRTFPIRLAIAKALNDLRPTKLSYHDLIRIDAELREAYKQLSRHLHGFKDHTTGPYELRFVDLIIRRYFLALHLPLFGPALHDATFAYSRRVVIDTATKLWQTTSGADDLASLSVCGAGFFRTIPIQAALVIAAELRAQLLEEECLGPRTARPDLVAILKESKDWSLKRIEAGETNIKGHLSICALIAQIDAIAQNLSDNEGYQSFVASVQQALHRCLAILQAASHVATISDSANEVEEDWEMPDFQFGVPESEGFFSFAPNWLLGDILPNVAL